jgi:hypothetical protein
MGIDRLPGPPVALYQDTVMDIEENRNMHASPGLIKMSSMHGDITSNHPPQKQSTTSRNEKEIEHRT